MRPVDFALLFLVGLGAQGPWWSLSTAADFFAAALPGARAEFWFGADYAIAVSLALPLNLSVTDSRLLWWFGIGALLLMMGSMMFFVVLPLLSIDASVAFWVSLVLCGVANFGSAVLLNACYSLFAGLHKRNSLVLQVSGVVCALLMGLLRVILLYSSIEILSSGIVFFSFCNFLMLVSLVCFFGLRRRHGKQQTQYSPLVASVSEGETTMEIQMRWGDTLKECWKPLVALFMDFTILFFCYPGLLSAIHCVDSRTFTVYAFLIFNGADAIGKFLPLLYTPKPNATLVLAILEWAIFLVLFAGSLPLKSVNEAFFSSEAYAYVLTGLLGVWHGWLCCSCFVLAPQIATDKNRAGSLSFMFNTSGIFVGSALSFILAFLVVPIYCN